MNEIFVMTQVLILAAIKVQFLTRDMTHKTREYKEKVVYWVFFCLEIIAAYVQFHRNTLIKKVKKNYLLNITILDSILLLIVFK